MVASERAAHPSSCQTDRRSLLVEEHGPGVVDEEAVLYSGAGSELRGRSLWDPGGARGANPSPGTAPGSSGLEETLPWHKKPHK